MLSNVWYSRNAYREKETLQRNPKRFYQTKAQRNNTYTWFVRICITDRFARKQLSNIQLYKLNIFTVGLNGIVSATWPNCNSYGCIVCIPYKNTHKHIFTFLPGTGITTVCDHLCLMCIWPRYKDSPDKAFYQPNFLLVDCNAMTTVV